MKSRIAFICVALASGCSGSRTEWWRDAASSDCLCPASAPECEASDCALINVRGLNTDGSYVQGVVRVSPSRQTATVVELFPGEYQDMGAKVRFTPKDARPFVVPVSRGSGRLTVNNVVQTRAPGWLASALDNSVANTRSH